MQILHNVQQQIYLGMKKSLPTIAPSTSSQERRMLVMFVITALSLAGAGRTKKIETSLAPQLVSVDNNKQLILPTSASHGEVVNGCRRAL